MPPQKHLSRIYISFVEGRRMMAQAGPTKKSVYYDQPRANSVCYALSFCRANCSTYRQPPKLQLTYTQLRLTMDTHYEHNVHVLSLSSTNYSVLHVDNCPNCNCVIPIQSESLKQVGSQAYINSQSHLNMSNMS